MNYNNICVFDFETSSADKNTCQILQIGAAIIDRWNLSVIDTFNCLAKPEDMETVEDEALQINRLKREDLEKAPDIKIVWGQFVNWVNKYNKSKGPINAFRAPIPAGYNIIGLTSSTYETTDEFRHNVQAMYNYYTTDEKTLKTIIRSNPGIILIKEGIIINKWHYKDIPSASQLIDKEKSILIKS